MNSERVITKIRNSKVRIPNFADFRLLKDVFLAQKVPAVVQHEGVLYINSVWFYVLAVCIFETEDLNIFSKDATLERYFDRLSPERKQRRKGYRSVKKKLRWIVEERSPFAFRYEKMGSGRFERYIMDCCLEYIVLKRMLFYFRRAVGQEHRAKRVSEYLKRMYPSVKLLFPKKVQRRILPRVNTYSGVINFKEFSKLKDNVKIPSTQNVPSIVLDSTVGYADSPYTDTAKIYKTSLMDSYFDEHPSELKNQDNWKNLFMFKSIRPDKIGADCA